MHPNLTVFVALLLLVGCASTRSASEMKEIQDTQGFLTQSLYYTGSSKSFHYFDQSKWLDKGWLLAELIPGVETDGYDRFKAPRGELSMPASLEFERSSYEGIDDDRRAKIRIKDGSPFTVERRKTARERFDEKYRGGNVSSNARVVQESGGDHALIISSRP